MTTIMRFVILGDDKGGKAFDSFTRSVENSNKSVDRSNAALKRQSATADASVKSFGSLVVSVSGFSDVSKAASRDAGMVSRVIAGIGIATGVAEPLMAGLVVAVGGLAAAAAPAMAGLGAYGLVLKSVGSTVQQLDTLQKAAATGSPKAVAALQQFTKGLTPSMRAFAGQLTTSKDLYHKWAAGLQAPVVNPITKLLKLTGPALKSITPLARAGASAVAQLMGEIGKKISGGGLDRVVNVLLPHVRPVILNLGHAIGNIVAGIWGVIKAFLPMSETMTGGVVKLTAKFKEWGQSLPSHTGFQSLMSMFRGQTPLAITLLHNLALIIKNLAATMTGLASPANSKALQQILVPLSAVMVKLTANQGLVRAVLYFMLLRVALVQLKPAFMGLKAGYDVAAGIGKIGSGFRDATVAADAASGVWGTMGGKLKVLTTWLKSSTIAQKAFTIEMWLFDAASSANVIGVIVIALIALAAAFYLAWTRSATFRKIVIGAWNAVWNAGKAVFNWLKSHWPLVLIILTGPFGVAVVLIVRNWNRILSAGAAVWHWIQKNWPLLLGILTGPIGLAVVLILKYWGRIQTGASLMWGFITRTAKNAVNTVRGWFAWLVDRILGIFGAIIHGAASAFGWIPGLGGKLKTAAKQFDQFRANVNNSLKGVNGRTVSVAVKWQQAISTGGTGVGVQPRARGGVIRGPGGPTDDKAGIFALSNEEYVVRASAHRKYGTRFLDAVNAGRLASGGTAGLNIKADVPSAGAIQSSVNAIVQRFAQIVAPQLGGNLGAMLQYALSFVGRVPYLWGGTSTSGWDCSGFMMRVLQHYGYSPPRTSQAQQGWASPAKNQPGALVFFGTPAYHVGMSLGNSQYVSALGSKWGTIVSSLLGNSGFGVPPGKVGFGGGGAGGSIQQMAKDLLIGYGWANQWNAFNSLEMREAGWRVNATNPSSGAYGLPQALPPSKMATAGLDWRTNPETQLRWMMGYIRDRYGSPNAAWAHEVSAGWYDRGSWKVPRTGPAVVHKDEMILPAGAAQRVRDGGGRSAPLVHIGSLQVREEADMAILAQKLSFAIMSGSLGGPGL